MTRRKKTAAEPAGTKDKHTTGTNSGREARGAVVGTLIGALVGGVLAIAASVVTNVWTDVRADEQDRRQAVGAARILADNLRLAEDVLDRSLQDCTYRFYDLELSLPLDDRMRLASYLSAGEWGSVAEGVSQLNIQQALSEQTGRFTYNPDVLQVRYTIRLVDKARKGLQELSGLGPAPVAELERELAGGESCRR